MDPFTVLSLFILILIGFGLGAATTLDDFKRALSTPKAVVIGLASQYFFMPLVAFCFAKIFGLRDEYAIGLILTGSSPGGTTSNIFTYWSKGNVALSITMSFFSNIAAFFMLPLLVFLLIKTALDVSIQIPWLNIFASLLLIILPCCTGLAIRHYNTEYKIRGMFIWKIVESLASVFGFIFLVAAVVFFMVDKGKEISEASAEMWICAVLMEPIGGLFGYGLARMSKLTKRDSRTIAIETGVQSFSLTIAIITLSFEGEERDKVVLFPLLYGFMYIFNSGWMIILIRYYLVPLDAELESDTKEAQKCGEVTNNPSAESANEKSTTIEIP